MDPSEDKLITNYLDNLSKVDSDLEESTNSLFSRLNNERLESFLLHSNDNLAVRSAWEQIVRGKYSNRNIHNPHCGNRAACWLVGFIEGRLSINVPEAWTNTLSRCELTLEDRTPDGGILRIPSSRYSNYKRNKLGFHTPLSLNIDQDHESERAYTLQLNEWSVPITSKWLPEISEPCINAITNDKKIFIVSHDQWGSPYPVRAMSIDHKLLWEADINIDGVGVTTGLPGVHWTEMKVFNNHVYIFGASLNNIYIYGFNIMDGKRTFEFCVIP